MGGQFNKFRGIHIDDLLKSIRVNRGVDLCDCLFSIGVSGEYDGLFIAQLV